MESKYRRLKLACYTGNITMSVVANLSPVLFLTFRGLYGISYSRLGFLVLINYVTQLAVDLVFSFFSHRFNIARTVRAMPLFAVGGFAVYGLLPWLFPQYAFWGLLAGTVLFSAASGLAEVLLSPIIAAIPARDPDREMSKLHSAYAWGTVGVVVASTLFLLGFGGENWHLLALLFLLIPLASACLFFTVSIPEMQTPRRVHGAVKQLRDRWLWLSVVAIFLGGAAECTMAQWASGYLEQAIGIPKVWGDVCGVALFAVALGLGRTLYSKYGANLGKMLTFGAIGATVCYLLCAVTDLPLAGLLACGFTGFCTSMMWPGNLVLASERFPAGGVFLYAMMAAGGDLGASVGPQMIGLITDGAMKAPALLALAQRWQLSPEQLGMKLGMLAGAIFPLLAAVVFRILWVNRGKAIRQPQIP